MSTVKQNASALRQSGASEEAHSRYTLSMSMQPQQPLISTDQQGRNQRVRLSAREIAIAFGGQRVLRGINLDLEGGQIALLRGQNGCGKTTLLNILSGFVKPDSGTARLYWDNKQVDVLSERPDRIARLGMVRLWQDIRLFPTMTVLENLLAASPTAIGINPLLALFAARRVKRQELQLREQALYWLELLGMADRADSSGDKLSVGQSKRVAIARMLQSGAQVLLLDEPLAGLDRDSAQKLVADLSRIANTTHKAMLVVEHNHDAIAPVCDFRLTFDEGRLRREGLESR